MHNKKEIAKDKLMQLKYLFSNSFNLVFIKMYSLLIVYSITRISYLIYCVKLDFLVVQ